MTGCMTHATYWKDANGKEHIKTPAGSKAEFGDKKLDAKFNPLEGVKLEAKDFWND